MALSKAKTASNGASGSYWKVTSIKVDKQAMTLSCSLSLFLSQAVADTSAGANLGVVKYYTFPITKANLVGDLTALAYLQIKTKISADPDLSGATDC
jgi:hypothetical protein